MSRPNRSGHTRLTLPVSGEHWVVVTSRPEGITLKVGDTTVPLTDMEARFIGFDLVNASKGHSE